MKKLNAIIQKLRIGANRVEQSSLSAFTSLDSFLKPAEETLPQEVDLKNCEQNVVKSVREYLPNNENCRM